MRIGAIAIAIAVPVSASAPADQYEPFVSADQTVQDHFTRLIWDRPREQDTFPPPAGYAAAAASCAAAGRRLPTLKELLTIVDEEPHAQYIVDHNEARYIDKAAFSNTPAEPFWTTSVSPTGAIYTVNFTTGFVGEASPGDPRNFRCVDD